MAITRETVTLVKMEHPRERDDHFCYSYGEETTFSDNGCDCFGLFFRRSLENDSKEQKSLLCQKGECGETWLVDKLKKMKEAPETLAGPTWTTFLRRLGMKRKNYRFQYDPGSYALNFDCSVDVEEDGLMRGFTSRYASPAPDDIGRMQ